MKEKIEGVDELVSRVGKYYGEMIASNMLTIDRLGEVCANEEERKLIGKLLENNLRLLRYLRLFTAYALYKYGTEDYYPKNSDIIQLLSSVCRQTREVLGNAVMIEEDFPVTPVMTVADAKSLRKCIFSLISNAARDCDKRIGLSLKKSKGNIIISVFDDGKPVDRVAKQRIEKGLADGVNNIDGSGMGLAVAAMVAKAHGGDLKFVQRKTGNEFRIVLPERTDNTLMYSAGVPEYGERYNPAVIELYDFYLRNLEDRK